MKEFQVKKRWILLSSLLISVIFTLLDALAHYFYEPLEIYFYPLHFFGIQSALINYAISKLVSSTIILFILFYIFEKTKLSKHAQNNLITFIVVILLEIRYIISGYYTPKWHVLNFINHYLTLIVGIYIIKHLVLRRR
ncbi:MAG TPA: hypothetical protein VJJ52_05525 [Candidatus Nanoarchaeia archaeon]|nr:hypothetical protein [Candidatus Nanoarchaeia archaeon]